MSTAYNIGQMNEVANCLENAAYAPTDVKRLTTENLKAILPFLHGCAEITPIKHLINLDTNPFVPEGCFVEKHQTGGDWEFNPAKLELYLSDNQQRVTINGIDLQKELLGKKVSNANVLDYLLENPYFIPERWKGRSVLFWGTIYRNSNGDRCVRCLRWEGSRWCWRYDLIKRDMGRCSPALVLR